MKNQDTKINQTQENVSTLIENATKLGALRDYVANYNNQLAQNAMTMAGKIIDVIIEAVKNDPVRFISENTITLTVLSVNNDLTELGDCEVCAKYSTDTLTEFFSCHDIISGANDYCIEALVCALHTTNNNFRFYIKHFKPSLKSIQEDDLKSFLLIQIRLSDLNDWER